MMNSRNVPPKASILIEALRGLGYTSASALADLIDNSISAGARNVSIFFVWAGTQSWIGLLDDGGGMSDSCLESAMRLGERNPLAARLNNDLGRFGLGLKTASFSQCRRLTVASKQSGKVSCLRWDLDVLASSDDGGWHLMEGPASGSEDILSKLDLVSAGTLVIWELLDRIITAGYSEQDFLDLIDAVERHLAMTFGRYLSRVSPKLTIRINGKQVTPWDPFLLEHDATWSSPVERISTKSGIVEVRSHVLPHKDRLTSAEHLSAGGPDGWTAQQGFYVYRNERLLVSGNWLGLGQGRPWTKEEAYRLARIKVDLSNTSDAEWKIDIRKSTARPPVAIRNRLARLAEDARERARRVFAYRGNTAQSTGAREIALAWRADRLRDGIRYRIDVNHPAVKAVLDQSGVLRANIEAMIRVIQETVPVQRIWLDTADAKETPWTGFAGDPPAEVVEVLKTIYRNLTEKKGYSPTLAKDQLLRMEPFHLYKDLVMALDSSVIEDERPVIANESNAAEGC